MQKIAPYLVVFTALLLAGGGLIPDTVDAKARIGGKSYSSKSYSAPAQKAAPTQSAPTQKKGSFSKGLAGGLLGGALGGLLFGSMFGAGGTGMGILPILLLAGAGYFLYRKFSSAQRQAYPHQAGYGGFPGQDGGMGQQPHNGEFTGAPPPPGSPMAVEAGIAEILQSDPEFDPNYFKEVASDVFFQVQAGWMRRDIDTFKHLLGDQLCSEYADHFARMRTEGVINKLESIAVRKVEISDAGCTGNEDFVTILFTANLLDYTVSDSTGELVEGSMTEPVKFVEEWTWARPVKTKDWRLEGIKSAN